MKPRIPAALPASLLLVTMVLMTGCAGFGKGEPVRMTATLQSVEDDLKMAEQETEATADALNELVVSDVADLEQAYGSFSDLVRGMQSTGERLMVHADEMRFQGAGYLVESEKSATACVYPRLRRPEDKTVADLGHYFDAIAQEGWDLKRAWRAYEFDISQIDDSISKKLTPKSVEAMTPFIRKAKVDHDSLKEALDQALAAIARAKAAKATER